MGGQMSREFKERMTEQLLSKALGGGSDRPALPEYCGECRFYHKDGGWPVGRCYRNPPNPPYPTRDSDVEQDSVEFKHYYNLFRPPVFAEDWGCGDGEKRG